MSLKNSSDTIGNRTRDLPVCRLILNTSYAIICLDRHLGLQEVEAPIISRKSAHEGGKIVSPTHRQSLPPQEITLILLSVRGWVDPRATVGTGELRQWNIPMTPIGIILNSNNVSANPGHPQGNSLNILEGTEDCTLLIIVRCNILYRGADKSLARLTSRCILFDG